MPQHNSGLRRLNRSSDGTQIANSRMGDERERERERERESVCVCVCEMVQTRKKKGCLAFQHFGLTLSTDFLSVTIHFIN